MHDMSRLCDDCVDRGVPSTMEPCRECLNGEKPFGKFRARKTEEEFSRKGAETQRENEKLESRCSMADKEGQEKVVQFRPEAEPMAPAQRVLIRMAGDLTFEKGILEIVVPGGDMKIGAIRGFEVMPAGDPFGG